MGDRLRDMQPSFGRGAQIHHCHCGLLHEVGRGNAHYKADKETVAFFIFNQIITRFGIPKVIVTHHGSHFQNSMMTELATMLGFKQEHSSSFYPQVNGQVEVVNKTLKTILKHTINAT